MRLCRVTGTVTASQKDQRLASAKLLIVQPIGLDKSLLDEADSLALDPKFGAGVGDIVLVAHEGAAAAQVMDNTPLPANVIVLGVVDGWDCVS